VVWVPFVIVGELEVVVTFVRVMWLNVAAEPLRDPTLPKHVSIKVTEESIQLTILSQAHLLIAS